MSTPFSFAAAWEGGPISRPWALPPPPSSLGGMLEASRHPISPDRAPYFFFSPSLPASKQGGSRPRKPSSSALQSVLVVGTRGGGVRAWDPATATLRWSADGVHQG